MDSGTGSAQIRQACERAVADLRIVIDTVSVTSAGKRRLVRVTVASDVAGLPDDDHTSVVEPLSLDEVADASRSVNEALDAADVMGAAAYTLEVSSPGVGQPVVTAEQFRRNVGRLLEVTRRDGSVTKDRLTAAGPHGIHLGSTAGSAMPYEDIDRAVVQVEFSRPTTGDSP
ncbi:MAG: ribosome maturation factor RimP [Ornithinimicrobium sp.]